MQDCDAGKVAVLIRRRALIDAAKSICAYCRGLEGHKKEAILGTDGYYWHLLEHANGWNRCSAGPIWKMINTPSRKGGPIDG